MLSTLILYGLGAIIFSGGLVINYILGGIALGVVAFNGCSLAYGAYSASKIDAFNREARTQIISNVQTTILPAATEVLQGLIRNTFREVSSAVTNTLIHMRVREHTAGVTRVERDDFVNERVDLEDIAFLDEKLGEIQRAALYTKPAR